MTKLILSGDSIPFKINVEVSKDEVLKLTELEYSYCRNDTHVQNLLDTEKKIESLISEMLTETSKIERYERRLKTVKANSKISKVQDKIDDSYEKIDDLTTALNNICGDLTIDKFGQKLREELYLLMVSGDDVEKLESFVTRLPRGYTDLMGVVYEAVQEAESGK